VLNTPQKAAKREFSTELLTGFLAIAPDSADFPEGGVARKLTGLIKGVDFPLDTLL